jgi:hypothetical protein
VTLFNIGLLLLASVFLLAAHLARATRVALLFPRTYRRSRFNMLLALSIGYAVDAVVPWRLGEIVRTWFVSERESIRFAYSAAAVAGERLSDLLFVSVVTIAVIAISVTPAPWALLDMAVGALAIGLVLAALAVAIHWSAKVRRAIWWAASLFNDRLRLGIADFSWSLGELVTGGSLVSRRYLFATLGMWLLYAIAYGVFTVAVDWSPFETAAMLLGAPFRPAAVTAYHAGRWAGLPILIFLGLPVLAVLVWGVVRQGSLIVRLLNTRRRFGFFAMSLEGGAYDRFRAATEYEYFLGSLFAGSDHALTGFGLKALDDGIVHKLFAGGSDAITALVEVDGDLVIRKFAAGAPGDKLEVQSRWLAEHGGSGMPLVDIVHQRRGQDFFLYDMPLVVPANDFYDVIHTSPSERSITLLREVCGHIARFHIETAAPPATDAIVTAYLEGKIRKNARAVLDFARTVLPSSSYSINGELYDLDEWDSLLDLDWLNAQVTDRSVATVHGDLTVENIIVAPQTGPGWYIIDPNPENVFNTPLVDWAKLMQSLHLGYEGINRVYSCTLNDDAILINLTKSQVYSDLHVELEALIGRYRGAGQLNEVYFHELVNYLRLTPYKIRQNAQKGLFFFACTSLLLRRYRSRVG